jgi:hypothetical protein
LLRSGTFYFALTVTAQELVIGTGKNTTRVVRLHDLEGVCIANFDDWWKDVIGLPTFATFSILKRSNAHGRKTDRQRRSAARQNIVVTVSEDGDGAGGDCHHL